MKNYKILKVALASVVLSVSSFVNASLITTSFDNGESLNNWTVDRAEPSSFEIVNNELVMDITGPLNPNGGFYDTQGMKLDIGQSTFMSIDMFIDSEWINDERYGGVWSIAYNNSDSISAYPILEFQGANGGSVASYDSNLGWADFSTLFNFDAFNTFAFEVNNAGVEYFINGTSVYTDSVSDVSYFGEVILNAKYDGSDYSVRYDNLTYGSVSVSEPSTLAIFALGIMGFASRRFKKQ